MAQPLQYQSQFIPTDFGTVGNILGMYRQDMNQRNQEFDQAAAMEAQTLADLGALSSYDEEGKQQRISNIEKLMKEAVAKRGGDYGAAARDITSIIAKERSNPWYQFNKEQQEAIKNYDQLKLNADNVIIGDPRIKYQDYRKAVAEGKNPFQVSGLSKSNLYNQVSKIASNFADKILTDPKISNTLGGQYFQIMQSKGVSPETFEAFINTGEGANIMKSVLAANPELQGANIDTVKEVVKQGLYSAIGPDSSQYVQDRGYIDAYDRYRMSADQNQGGYYPAIEQSGSGLLPESITDLKSRMFSGKANEAAIKEAEKLGIPGVKSFQDLENLTKEGFTTREGSEGVDFDNPFQVQSKPKSEYYEKATQALKNIESLIPSGDFALPTWNFNSLAVPSGKSITEVNKLEEGFTDEVLKNKQRFTGISNKDSKNFEKITKNFSVDDISTDFKQGETGIFMYVSGLDKDDNPITARIELNPTETKLEQRLMRFATSLNNDLLNEYEYGKNPKGKIAEAYKDLEEAIQTGRQAEANAIATFIGTKTGELYGKKYR